MLCVDSWHMILYIAISTAIRQSNPLRHNLYDYLCYYLNVTWLKLKLYDLFNHHINWWKIAPNRYKTKLFPSNFSWNGWYLLFVCYIGGWFGFFSMQFGFGLVGCSVSCDVGCGVVWWLVKQSKLLFSAWTPLVAFLVKMLRNKLHSRRESHKLKLFLMDGRE